MTTFLIALAILVAGYLVYAPFVGRVFGTDPKRQTPVMTMADGVDYVALPTWKIYLIQFLNIAGLGPIFGAIMGIMFGPAAFLWIVFGTVFAGAVHDFLAAMLSVRRQGASLPEIIGQELGPKIKTVMRVFTLFLMVLVGAVFVYNPADLLAMLTPEKFDRLFWVAVIFVYYMCATMLPIDKLIGRLYPVFGFSLLFMAVGILTALFFHADAIPEIWDGLANRKSDAESSPIFPMMFVSIACGAISGFHATQSPMMARCLKSEKHGRLVFYGAMITEGIVALIWAAAAIAFTGGYDELQQMLNGSSPAVLVNEISTTWLGKFGGILAILGVIAAPITSGDTALRSARLIAADFLGYDQKTLRQRLLVSVPIFVVCAVIMMIPYEYMWRYFAWFNQMLAVFTLWALTVWLAREKKPYVITLIPAMFMTCVTITYILFAPEGLGILTNYLAGTPMPYSLSLGIGLLVTALVTGLFASWLRRGERRVMTPSI